MSHADANGLLGEGENLEVDPPRRLVQSMVAFWSEDVKSEGSSRVTWEMEPIGDSCRLTVTHDELREDANAELYSGWPMIGHGSLWCVAELCFPRRIEGQVGHETTSEVPRGNFPVGVLTGELWRG